MEYYTIITFLSITLFIMLIVMVATNDDFEKKIRKKVILLCLISIIAIMTEWVKEETIVTKLIKFSLFITLVIFFNIFVLITNKGYKKVELCAIMIFLVIWEAILILNRKMEILWLLISIFSIFVYMYYKEIGENIDELTKVFNQKSFLNTTKNIKKKCAIIIFDVNDFKYINDTYGHKQGDIILYKVANIIKQHYAEYGKTFRIGGDEFSVIMEKSVDDAKEITSKFMDNYKEKRSEKMPYISYGVAIYDPKIAQLNYETIEDAIKEADKEMYEYKRAYKKRKSLS